MNYTVKILENNKEVGRYESSSYRRFYNHVGTINWQKLMKKGRVAYLRVSTPDGYNDGEYATRDDFFDALTAFIDL